MKLIQQFRTIPIGYTESPKNDGDEIVISEDITFTNAIEYVNSWCKEINYFHHYSVNILKPTSKQPCRMAFYIYIQDPNKKIEYGDAKRIIITGHENELAPNIICIFTLYNNDEHPYWSGYYDFNISNI